MEDSKSNFGSMWYLYWIVQIKRVNRYLSLFWHWGYPVVKASQDGHMPENGDEMYCWVYPLIWNIHLFYLVVYIVLIVLIITNLRIPSCQIWLSASFLSSSCACATPFLTTWKVEGSEMNDSSQPNCAQMSIQMLWHDSQSYRKLSQVAQWLPQSVGEPDFLHKTLHFPRISFTSIMVCSWAWWVQI